MDNTLIPNGTSTNDVQFQSTNNVHSPLDNHDPSSRSDVDTTILIDTPTTEPFSLFESLKSELLSNYDPYRSTSSGMYQYMWDNHYSGDSDCESSIRLLGEEWSHEMNEELNEGRRWEEIDEWDDTDMFFDEFWSDPTKHGFVREHIHEELETECNPYVIDLLFNYYVKDGDFNSIISEIVINVKTSDGVSHV